MLIFQDCPTIENTSRENFLILKREGISSKRRHKPKSISLQILFKRNLKGGYLTFFKLNLRLRIEKENLR